jgi:hypothetical protein
VGHTRAIQRERRQHAPDPIPPEDFTERLTELVYPVALAVVRQFHRRGLRERVLTLPVRVAFGLALVWRQVGGVAEWVRLVRQQVIFGVPPLKVSPQAVEQRLRCLPADLFRQVLDGVLPPLHAAWPARYRSVPTAIAWARTRFSRLLVCDASTLDVLLRKVGALQGLPKPPLAGRITALLDLGSRLPWRVWFELDAAASEQKHWPELRATLPAQALVVFDRGYTNFQAWADLTVATVTWITRARSNLGFRVERVLEHSATVRDLRIRVGRGNAEQTLRLVEACFDGTWYRYLTNELDPVRLPAVYVALLYRQRWRIEEAFFIVKRLLGLSYLWSGARNAVEFQLWSTWLLYAVLIDLTDAVAEALNRPFNALSITRIFGSLPYAADALHRGQTTSAIGFLAENATWLGIIKRPRVQPKPKEALDVTEEVLTWD